MVTIVAILVACTAVTVSVYFAVKSYQAKAAIEKREKDVSRRMFELAILKELGDRIGYSLDVQQIIDVITNSLHQFIEYSAVSYMLLEPEKVIFKIHLENSVHRRFVNDVRDRMLGSLGALLDREFDKKNVEEILSGAIIIEELENPVRSFFNIPLVIDEKVVGVLTVADTKEGLYKEEEMTILYKLIQQASKAVTSLQGVVKTEQAKVNAMVESMEDGVVMTDADYRILVINPAAKRIIGKEKKEEVTIFDFIDNLGGKMDIRGRLEESVKLKKTYASERFGIRDRFYQSFVFPVKTTSALNGDEVLGGVVIFHDVTREVELEHVRDDFTSMIVHELRTPLSGIQKASELLKLPIKKSVMSSKQYVDVIYQNSSSMLDLVNDILDAAKLQAGKFEISREPANIETVIANRIDFFAMSAGDKKIRLTTSVDKGVPKEIPFDVQRIKQVLNNLISNALKFTMEGGTISISAFVHEAGASIANEAHKAEISFPEPIPEEKFSALPKSLVITVTDTGVGIPASDISELFSKFKQLNNNKATMPNIKGTGLGLSISRGIVGEHGGIIDVVSKVDVGSTFYFVLPLEKPESV